MTRPIREPQLARRAAMTALAFLALAALDLAWEGARLGSVQRAFPLYAMGGLSVLVFGTSRLLVAGMDGRDITGGAWSATLVLALASLGALLTFLTGSWIAAALWSLAALAHALVMLTTHARGPPTRASIGRTPPAARALEAGALAYAAASAFALPLAYAGRLALAAAWHLALVGFVLTMILGAGTRILPRFTRAQPPRALAWTMLPLALAGPALVAAGLTPGHARLLAAGAIVEALAVALYAASATWMLSRASKPRLHYAAYALAILSIALGGALGLAFAFGRATLPLAATHALLNVFGFVGLTVLAASTDLYGPALDVGAASQGRLSRAVVTLAVAGLAIAAAGAWTQRDDAARSGMLLYAAALLAQLAGVIATHRRAGKVGRVSAR